METIKIKFAKGQKSELIAKAEIRLDTINEDPFSAFGEVETTDNALEDLIDKLRKSDEVDLNKYEIEFLIIEADNSLAIMEANRYCEGIKLQSYINSINNALDKLYKAELYLSTKEKIERKRIKIKKQ